MQFLKRFQTFAVLYDAQGNKAVNYNYIYAHVKEQGQQYGRLGIELNNQIANISSKELKDYLYDLEEYKELDCIAAKVQESRAMKVEITEPKFQQFSEKEFERSFVENAVISQGDLIKIDNSGKLYIMLEDIDESHLPEEERLPFIKVGNICNEIGFNILNEMNAKYPTGKLDLFNFGTYRKLYSMKLIKAYCFFSFAYIFHQYFASYKERATILDPKLSPNQ